MSTYHVGDKIRRMGGVVVMEVTQVREQEKITTYALKRADGQSGEVFTIQERPGRFSLVKRFDPLCPACGEPGPLTDIMLCPNCEADLFSSYDVESRIEDGQAWRTR